MFEQISEKALLDVKHPLPKYTLRSLHEKLLLEWTYNSNAAPYLIKEEMEKLMNWYEQEQIHPYY
ncbi:hypothetical protein [Alkalihalobacillus deserti]|uniref:hypothetical protein n=1 Tax=Alkalihalobacillus deserti TaxID=2879466 RepID=UPI001D15019E|nr:hypothetical protein [Alkalihalobacillus deserti]